MLNLSLFSFFFLSLFQYLFPANSVDIPRKSGRKEVQESRNKHRTILQADILYKLAFISDRTEVKKNYKIGNRAKKKKAMFC